MNFKKAAVIFSFAFPIISAILIINFLTGIISMPWQGMPVLFPLLLSPIGIMLALVSIKTNKRWAIWGIILNSILLLFPFFFFIGGTLLFGV
ncbi:hypothetical protein ACUUYQ_02695 [Bacillus halotolerans]|uniref:hypothetical protein n=1 Tax=Bacillus TaxID=1386 RepID=UPI0003D79FFD|nr:MULTISPECIES: hypothetical protein [Bacillus]PAY14408.1 hypothetical protein CJU60_04355 [Bacillus sp. 7705b]AZV51319.1 hypothetical protein DIC78_21230 [Bacillus halotolerans]QDK69230.1 hypothetical protein FLQ13_18405 [Bacillus halotolerans]WOC55051.1 hypothetical protein RYX39_10620 [Bacillus halotolerans]WPC78739.1 hypothetical protein RA179_10490 [Bacillus halotolerans]